MNGWKAEGSSGGEMEVRLFGSRERAAGKMQAGEVILGGVFTTATGGARLGSIFRASPFSW
jgi:hypothetical protein